MAFVCLFGGTSQDGFSNTTTDFKVGIRVHTFTLQIPTVFEETDPPPPMVGRGRQNCEGIKIVKKIEKSVWGIDPVSYTHLDVYKRQVMFDMRVDLFFWNLVI